jgi:hypothetical protein
MMATAKKQRKSKDEAEQQLAKELPMTFPASDPLASAQPGGGITGPEVKPLEPPAQDKSARR